MMILVGWLVNLDFVEKAGQDTKHVFICNVANISLTVCLYSGMLKYIDNNVVDFTTRLSCYCYMKKFMEKGGALEE